MKQTMQASNPFISSSNTSKTSNGRGGNCHELDKSTTTINALMMRKRGLPSTAKNSTNACASMTKSSSFTDATPSQRKRACLGSSKGNQWWKFGEYHYDMLRTVASKNQNSNNNTNYYYNNKQDNAALSPAVAMSQQLISGVPAPAAPQCPPPSLTPQQQALLAAAAQLNHNNSTTIDNTNTSMMEPYNSMMNSNTDIVVDHSVYSEDIANVTQNNQVQNFGLPPRNTPNNNNNREEEFENHPDTEDSAAGDEESTSDSSTALRFRQYQAENWTDKFEDLLKFRDQHGHCFVPNHYEDNPALAQWVKRQRYQYKLKLEGKHSTMSDERVTALNEVGFIWDSHSALWQERFNELCEYKRVNGHCNVPSRYTGNRQLAVWVKRQRRQYKFYCEGQPSSMSPERISILEKVGFEWDLRQRK